MKLESYKPRELALIALPPCDAKRGHEGKQRKNSFFAQPTGFMSLQFRGIGAFDVEGCNYCFFLEKMQSLQIAVYYPLHKHPQRK